MRKRRSQRLCVVELRRSARSQASASQDRPRPPPLGRKAKESSGRCDLATSAYKDKMSAQIDGDPKPARFQISYSLAILWKINVWKFEFYGANFGILRNVLILQPGGFVQPFVPKGIISKLFFFPPLTKRVRLSLPDSQENTRVDWGSRWRGGVTESRGGVYFSTDNL